jgi:hypothetical protein
MKDGLTPEQRQALIEAGAALTRAAADIITAMTNAIAPIMDWYNSLPDEIKQQVAASQVAKEHPTLFPAEPEKKADNFDFYHWVDCDKKGVVNVYHVSDCEKGEDCELFRYLSAPGTMEKHLKRGHEYEVIKDKAGQFEFSQTNKTGTDIIKSTKRESSQISLLEK